MNLLLKLMRFSSQVAESAMYQIMAGRENLDKKLLGGMDCLVADEYMSYLPKFKYDASFMDLYGRLYLNSTVLTAIGNSVFFTNSVAVSEICHTLIR